MQNDQLPVKKLRCTPRRIYFKNTGRYCVAALLVAGACIGTAFGQNALPGSRDLKKLSVEELMNIEVISVSKAPEKLSEVPSAIQVITGDDILRSAYTTLPEALRLAPNLQVAKPNSHDWSISSRGFNGAPVAVTTLSNKLLVMIDGRSVYTPLFAGVFWDVQNLLLEDIDRVEVVSGPGGTLWGANAVNGVINVISKSAKETQGIYAAGSIGTFQHDYAAVRYGARLAPNLYFRAYEQQYDQGNMKLRDGSDAKDGWSLTQGGFRMDYLPNEKDSYTFHGDIYGGTEENPALAVMNGQNLVGGWTHNFNNHSALTVNAYFDRTWRILPRTSFKYRLNTYDLDVQHRFHTGNHNILWGVGYRLMTDDVQNSPSLSLIPSRSTMNLVNTFIQDQISIIPRKLEFTIGTKLLYNDYTQFELQPSARIAWLPAVNSTIWAAISRAVRTPSRFEADEITGTISTPNGNFRSESVVAYELGYKLRPVKNLSFSLATFYNKYDYLRSVNNNPNPTNSTRFIFANDQSANSWGFELSSSVVATSWWRLRGGFTYLDKKFYTKNADVIPTAGLLEALDPKSQFMFQSVMNLPAHWQLDIMGRYVDKIESTLPTTIAVSSYATFDVRVAWEYKWMTITLRGQNLATADHTEFSSRQVPRNVSLQMSIRL